MDKTIKPAKENPLAKRATRIAVMGVITDMLNDMKAIKVNTDFDVTDYLDKIIVAARTK